MSMLTRSTELFRRVVAPDATPMRPDVAEFVLSLDFRGEDHTRYEILAAKAREGSLSCAEEEELESFLHVDAMLGVLRIKAMKSVGPGRG
jgi:hypothetical protein